METKTFELVALRVFFEKFVKTLRPESLLIYSYLKDSESQLAITGMIRFSLDEPKDKYDPPPTRQYEDRTESVAGEDNEILHDAPDLKWKMNIFGTVEIGNIRYTGISKNAEMAVYLVETPSWSWAGGVFTFLGDRYPCGYEKMKFYINYWGGVKFYFPVLPFKSGKIETTPAVKLYFYPYSPNLELRGQYHDESEMIWDIVGNLKSQHLTIRQGERQYKGVSFNEFTRSLQSRQVLFAFHKNYVLSQPNITLEDGIVHVEKDTVISDSSSSSEIEPDQTTREKRKRVEESEEESEDESEDESDEKKKSQSSSEAKKGLIRKLRKIEWDRVSMESNPTNGKTKFANKKQLIKWGRELEIGGFSTVSKAQMAWILLSLGKKYFNPEIKVPIESPISDNEDYNKNLKRILKRWPFADRLSF